MHTYQRDTVLHIATNTAANTLCWCLTALDVLLQVTLSAPLAAPAQYWMSTTPSVCQMCHSVSGAEEARRGFKQMIERCRREMVEGLAVF
jgi:hypothetical protein